MFSLRTDTDGWKEKICFSLTLSHVVGTSIDASQSPPPRRTPGRLVVCNPPPPYPAPPVAAQPTLRRSSLHPASVVYAPR